MLRDLQTRGILHRAGGVPVGSITHVYGDCDRLAARALDPRLDPAPVGHVVADLSHHAVPPVAVAFTYGLACGLRMGMGFRASRPPRQAPEPPPPPATTDGRASALQAVEDARKWGQWARSMARR